MVENEEINEEINEETNGGVIQNFEIYMSLYRHILRAIITHGPTPIRKLSLRDLKEQAISNCIIDHQHVARVGYENTFLNVLSFLNNSRAERNLSAYEKDQHNIWTKD